MEIRQQFTIDRPIGAVWAALSDVRLVASCMPGAEVVSVSDDQREVEGRIRAKVGPIAAAFAGRATITRDETSHTGTLEGGGMDKSNGSRVQVNLTYALVPDATNTATTTTIVAKMTLSGLLAQFGKGPLINDIAGHMTKEFTATLRQRLTEARPDAAAAGVTSGAGSGEAAPTAAAINPLGLLFTVLKARLKRLFGMSVRGDNP